MLLFSVLKPRKCWSVFSLWYLPEEKKKTNPPIKIENFLTTEPIFQLQSIWTVIFQFLTKDSSSICNMLASHPTWSFTYHHFSHILLIFKIPRNKKVSTPMMITNSLFFVALMDAVIISKPLCASIISTTSIVRHDIFNKLLRQKDTSKNAYRIWWE